MTTCCHARTEITETPQAITLHYPNITVDVTIPVTAACRNGHSRTLHVVAIADMREALDQLAEWANSHNKACTGTVLQGVA